jgi:hypothetical protein
MDKDYLILKRASASRPSGEWSDDDFNVLAGSARFMTDGCLRSTWLRTSILVVAEGERPDPRHSHRRSGGARPTQTPSASTSSSSSRHSPEERDAEARLRISWPMSAPWGCGAENGDCTKRDKDRGENSVIHTSGEGCARARGRRVRQGRAFSRRPFPRIGRRMGAS